MQLAPQHVPEVGDHGCDPTFRAFAGPAASVGSPVPLHPGNAGVSSGY